MHLEERGRHGLDHDLRHLATSSLSLGIHRCVDVRLAGEDAPRVDEWLDANDDEENLEHEPLLAVVPVDHDDEGDLDGHAEQHRREQRGGEAGVAGAVVDRDAEDVGAHVRNADAGGQGEPDLVYALRVEEGAEATDQREEASASCRRHLEHSRITTPRRKKLKPGAKGEAAKGGIYGTVEIS